MNRRPLVGHLWIACLLLASGMGCAQHPGASGGSDMPPTKPAEAPSRMFLADWSYERKEACVPGYASTLHLHHADGNTVRGEWTSYNSDDGREGDVLGDLRGDRLLLRFCQANGKHDGELACPEYGPAKVYVKKQGRSLSWHSLENDRPISPGEGTALEYACRKAENGSSAQSTRRDEAPKAANASTESFAGNWSYQQGCGWEHTANLRIKPQSGRKVTGTWDDGTRVRGDHGTLIGELRDGRLHLRFCGTDELKSDGTCTTYGEEDAYVVRAGDQLVWLRKFGESRYVEYLRLHYTTPNHPTPLDNDCDE